MNTRLTVCTLAMALVLLPSCASAAAKRSYVPAYKVEDSSLAGLMDHPLIWDFDLSPDGKAIAMIVVAGSRTDAPMWLVTEDLPGKRITASSKLGDSAWLAWQIGSFAPQVIYSSDQRYLIIQDLRTIRVMESSSLKLVKTISPPAGQRSLDPVFVIAAGKRDIVACAFAAESKHDFYVHTTPVQVKVVDISSGETLGEWAADDVPQSLSSDGNLLALSSTQPRNGVLPLTVLDIHGKKLAETSEGFSFRKADGPKPIGRILAVFVGNQKLLLGPDQGYDKTGHSSAYSLQLVSVSEKGIGVVKRIEPEHYLSQGEFAASADGNVALSTSLYAPALVLAHPHWALPPSSPELLVLGTDAGLQIEARVNIDHLGVRPRLSSDGSVIAIAQGRGITVLTRRP